MAQHTRPARQRRDDDTSTDTVEVTDQQDKQLTEEVACCLAEIDKVLEDQETERDRAIREFRKIKHGTSADLRLWQAKYAHLAGLNIHRGGCCAYLTEDGQYIA